MHDIQLATPSDSAAIEAALLADLRQRSPQGHNETIALAMKAPDGSLIAGLNGSTSYGWLLVKVLWVAPDQRRRGYGRALIAEAFRKAKALECQSAWLDTSDCEARQFYERLGFSVFGALQNSGSQVPPGHQRWFMNTVIP